MSDNTEALAAELAVLSCPFCGGPAKRVTPMGEWGRPSLSEPGRYGPDGVRYVCEAACQLPHYGEDAEAKALANWNTRLAAPPSLEAVKAEARREALEEAAKVAEGTRLMECKEFLRPAEWVDSHDDEGNVLGQVLNGAVYRLNPGPAIAARIRAIPSEKEG